MRDVFNRVLHEADAPLGPDEDSLDERREIATQDILLEVLAILERRGIVRRVQMTMHAEAWPTSFKSTLVADGYRKRTQNLGLVRVFVTIPRGSTDPGDPALVRFDWALKMGGVWYTWTVKVRDPLDSASIRAVIPAIHGMQVTLDGVVDLDDANHTFSKRKKNRVRDKAVLQGLRWA